MKNLPIWTRTLTVVLAGFLAAPPASAGTILKWQETTRLDGQPAHKAVLAYSGPLGLRVQSVEIGSTTASSVILWVAATGTLHVNDGEKGWVTVTPDLIAGLRSRAKRAPGFSRGARLPRPRSGHRRGTAPASRWAPAP